MKVLLRVDECHQYARSQFTDNLRVFRGGIQRRNVFVDTPFGWIQVLFDTFVTQIRVFVCFVKCLFPLYSALVRMGRDFSVTRQAF